MAWRDQLDGGLADERKPSDYCPEQIEKGKKVEMEHTDDPAAATEIAMDHLEEFEGAPYYDYLDDMEKEMRHDMKHSSWRSVLL